MFEAHHQPLISTSAFTLRLIRHTLLALAIIAISLLIGVWGYHAFEALSWTDSLLNASMILGGMGPVASLQSEGGKIFASMYALYSGVVFLVAIAIIFAPVLHRFLHTFHLDNDN